MKYHGLKMEEVNDTMRHLWNKTYQGTGETNSFVYSPTISHFHTDIDGIKIRSDVEGGASKRSYHYRVNLFFLPLNMPSLTHRALTGRDDERSSRDGHARAVLRWPEDARIHHHPARPVGLLWAKLWDSSAGRADERIGYREYRRVSSESRRVSRLCRMHISTVC